MNLEALELWRNGVMENNHQLASILSDKMQLKNAFAGHLKQFFDFDKIVFSNDLSLVTLKWEYGRDIIIDYENTYNIGMDWVISTEYSDELGQGLVVKVYPFGLKEESDN